MKLLFYILIFLSLDIEGQNLNRDSFAYGNLTFRNIEDINNLYKPKVNSDTTFILTALWTLRAFDEIFILSRMNDRWSARYFCMDYKREMCFSETKLNTKDEESIWQSIKSDNLLTLSDDVRDSSGVFLDLYILHGIYYHIKIFTLGNLRDYVYHSPQAYAKEFPNEIIFRNVVSIIEKIYKSYGIRYLH